MENERLRVISNWENQAQTAYQTKLVREEVERLNGIEANETENIRKELREQLANNDAYYAKLQKNLKPTTEELSASLIARAKQIHIEEEEKRKLLVTALRKKQSELNDPEIRVKKSKKMLKEALAGVKKQLELKKHN